jgi:hypothetical protein
VIRRVRDGSKKAAEAARLSGCTDQTLLAYWQALGILEARSLKIRTTGEELSKLPPGAVESPVD